MRIKITIDITNKWIPFEYHGFIQGVIYHALDIRLGSFFHDKGFYIQDRKYKMFVFSELSGRYHIHKKGLIFEEPASFYISSVSSDFMNQLYLYFKNTTSITLGKQIVKVLDVTQVEDVTYHDNNEYILQTLSPITCYKTDKKHFITYFHPKSQDFENSLKDNISRKYKILFKNDFYEYFKIVEIIRYKEVKVKYKKSIYIGYICTMKINVSNGYLKLLLHVGLGAKNAAGFGMVKIV